MTATVSAPPTVEVPIGKSHVRVRRPWLPWAVLALAFAFYLIGVGSIKHAASVQSQWGLLTTASPMWTFAYLTTIVGFAIGLRYGSVRAAIWATVLIGVIVRLPRTIENDDPMYSWTYKHIGVVDYFQHAHQLARGVDIYSGWPGLFAFTAWFGSLTGMSSTTIAHWFTPFFTALFALLVYGAGRAWGLAPLAAATAMFLAVTFNWVGQDYFSPQAMAMLFVPGIIALIGLSRQRAVATPLLIILYTAATITHQLTPFWALLVIGILVLSRQMKPWWVVIPLAALVMGQLAYNWEEVSRYTLFSVDLVKNTESNIMRYNVHPTLGQRVVSYGNKTLASSLWLATGLVLLFRWRRKQPFWAMGVLALAGMLILGGADYGGEAIFRVYLYCLIGCTMVLAPVVVSVMQGDIKKFAAGVVAALVAVVLSVNGETGTWYANVMPKAQVDTSHIVLAQAELPAYLTPAAPVWPERSTWRYVDYARFNHGFDYPMIYDADLVATHFNTDADYQKLVEALNGRVDASTYLIITDQMQVYCWYFGILPWDALPNLKKRLFADTERWEPFYDGQGITVFVHKVNPNAPSSAGSAPSTGSTSTEPSPTEPAPPTESTSSGPAAPPESTSTESSPPAPSTTPPAAGNSVSSSAPAVEGQ